MNLTTEEIVSLVTAVVTIASLVAKLFPKSPASKIGKLLQWLIDMFALNAKRP